jgi:hypothetical protein
MPSEEKNGIKKCLETLRECIDLMFWGVFYKRVFRPDVKMRVETIELMNTQFFNEVAVVNTKK